VDLLRNVSDRAQDGNNISVPAQYRSVNCASESRNQRRNVRARTMQYQRTCTIAKRYRRSSISASKRDYKDACV
jgi:head-tail adaptor